MIYPRMFCAMPRYLLVSVVMLAMLPVHAADAENARAALLAQYLEQARRDESTITAFDPQQGAAFHRQMNPSARPGRASCHDCHGDPHQSGRTPQGKAIEPMAVSSTPTRYLDSAKVEKWFRRNCQDVLERPCTAREKGDWLSFMMNQ